MSEGLDRARAELAASQAVLAEYGRVLASEREDLIAQGVDPAVLEVPLHPDDLSRGASNG